MKAIADQFPSVASYRPQERAEVPGLGLDSILFLATWAAAIVASYFLAWKGIEVEAFVASFAMLALALPLAFRATRHAVLLVPLICVLGPASRFEVGSVAINVSDLYVLALAVGGLLHGKFALTAAGPKAPVSAAFMGLLVLLSFIFSISTEASFLALVALVQLVVIWAVTVNVIRTREDILRYTDALFSAATLAAALILISYFRGVTLLMDESRALRDQFAILQERADVFFRATYFSATFIFPLAAGLVCQFPRLASEHFSIVSLISRLLAFGVAVSAALAMGNKTLLYAVAAIGLCTSFLVFLFGRDRHPQAVLRFVLLPIVILPVIGLIAYIFQEWFPENQRVQLVGHFSNTDTLFIDRVWIWTNSLFSFAQESAIRIFFGFGPDTSVRLQSSAVFENYFHSMTSDVGALDSSYLYWLINFGLILFLFAVIWLFRQVFRLFRLFFKCRLSFVLVIAAGLAVHLLMGVSQQATLSKMIFSWAQLCALGSVALRISRSAPKARAEDSPGLAIEHRVP
jgi:hypothetical protein